MWDDATWSSTLPHGETNSLHLPCQTLWEYYILWSDVPSLVPLTAPIHSLTQFASIISSPCWHAYQPSQLLPVLPLHLITTELYLPHPKSTGSHNEAWCHSVLNLSFISRSLLPLHLVSFDHLIWFDLLLSHGLRYSEKYCFFRARATKHTVYRVHREEGKGRVQNIVLQS